MLRPTHRVLPLLLAACYPGGALLEGLARRPDSDTGPQIVWDLDARPLPEIPFPNDVGTRPDLSSPTGRRVNVSTEAPTAHERKLRRLVNTLDGFGTYAPLWVRFDARLDLESLHALQTNADPTDDPIYLVNADPRSPRFGERVPIELGSGPRDLGRTRFPVGLDGHRDYFRNDPRAGHSNILFETAEEDRDGDGVLDAGEDTDGDGVLDHPNLWGHYLGDDYARLAPHIAKLAPLGVSPETVRQHFDLITFYELETDTLIFRPVLPLDEATTYAVVLTRRMVGSGGGAIRSPFEWVHHLQQTAALRPLVLQGKLAEHGVGLEDIAFAWSFTTQSITRDMEALRAGLYGTGPFAWLAEQYPARLTQVLEPEARPGNHFILSTERLLDVLERPEFTSVANIDPGSAGPLFQSYRDNISHFVFAAIDTPIFIDNEDGAFRVDANEGTAEVARAPVYLSCAVPRPRAGHTQPFPVVFYGHGYTSARWEFLGFAGSLGRFGLATCAIEAYGHGVPESELILTVVQDLLQEEGLGQFADIIFMDRSRDLNGDGATDSGGDFWTANTFHTRDIVRQSIIDHMATIRIMRAFGTGTMPADVDGDGADELSGDFDGDGTADLGGEQPYYAWGQSLGGILSAILGAVEPAVLATAPGSGGGGLIDIAAHGTQGGVVQAVFLPMMGPLIIGEPSSVPGRIDLSFHALNVNDDVRVRFAIAPDPFQDGAPFEQAIAIGDRIAVVNLDNGEAESVVIGAPVGGEPAGRFRLQVAADMGDRLRLELFRAGAAAPYRVIDTFSFETDPFYGVKRFPGAALVALQDGFAHPRQSPSLRRLLGFAQMVVDPADPVNFARYYAQPYVQRPEGAVPHNLLVINTVGDTNVPVSTGIAISRAAGHFGPGVIDPRYGKSVDDVLLDSWVIEGLEKLRRFAVDPCRYDEDAVLFDVDDSSHGAEPAAPPRLARLVPSPDCEHAVGGPSWCERACVAAPPLRVTVSHPHGVSGMRILYVDPTGEHGFAVPHTLAPFDYDSYQVNQLGWYFATGGRELVDDPCLASLADACSFY